MVYAKDVPRDQEYNARMLEAEVAAWEQELDCGSYAKRMAEERVFNRRYLTKSEKCDTV